MGLTFFVEMLETAAKKMTFFVEMLETAAKKIYKGILDE